MKNAGAALEDLFPDDFYRACVNQAFGLAIAPQDHPKDGTGRISDRVEQVLKARHGHPSLDRKRVTGEMLKRFDSWSKARDPPGDTAKKAAKLFGIDRAEHLVDRIVEHAEETLTPKNIIFNIQAELGTLKAEDLRLADEVFMTSTAGGIMPVRKIDDRVIGTGTRGPVTKRLTDLYWALHDDPAYATPVNYLEPGC